MALYGWFYFGFSSPLRQYRIFPAIRRGFCPSRMTSNNLISPMKFCYNTNSTLPKQCQSSRSILQDGSRTFGLFWKEKNPSYNRRYTVFQSLSGHLPERGRKREMIDKRKNVQTIPTRTHCKRSRPIPYYYPN